MRVGVISDTHGLLRPEALAMLEGAAHIIHAGDIGDAAIVPRLARIAPVSAIRGNVDTADWAGAFPPALTLKLAGQRIHVLHDVAGLDFAPAERGIGLVISGHSHRPGISAEQGTVWLNPGSAGPRRFRLPVTLALLDLEGGAIEPVIHALLP
ncbi:metallophosphoesterase family protein [soil metagenome]